MPDCSTPDCDRTDLAARGLCRKCYARDRRARMPPCVVDSCSNPQVSKGFCSTHYQRQHLGRGLEDPPGGRRRVIFPVQRINVALRGPGGRKFCRWCQRLLPEAQFARHGNRRSRDILRSRCRECSPKPRRAPGVRHNLDEAARAAILADQGGGCAICGTTDPGRWWCVDHDHRCCSKESCGHCVRGMLCNGCNSAIGMAREDPTILRAAADYLEKPARLPI